MIITKNVNIKVNGFMVQKYNEIGFNVKVNDIISLPVEKLSRYSHLHILCSCDICGEKKEITYNNYAKYIEKKSIYTCKKCNLDSREKTCMAKYGVKNVSNLESRIL